MKPTTSVRKIPARLALPGRVVVAPVLVPCAATVIATGFAVALMGFVLRSRGRGTKMSTPATQAPITQGS